ncbi:MAG: phosphate ABC transporter permease subunit PstC [Deltaproteobacteria bacterium]|nr:phosphate ABC transporter permease subunit PstC [Deltaproteobacteria bacterium]MCL5276297.1 phosphate ABC transporter permease subunit PstC [Deltaproteobacteria bacterium]
MKLATGDRTIRFLSTVFASMILLLIAVIVYELFKGSELSIGRFGLKFLVTTTWDPVNEVFGALPFIFGTIVSSVIALIIALPISIGIAVFLSELAPQAIRPSVSLMIELLAAIPSIIYGLWGLFVMVPFLQMYVEPVLSRYFGSIPLFGGVPIGVGMLAGGIILSIMIIPTIASISRDIFNTVPMLYKEAGFALGMTRWEVISKIVFPHSRSGLTGAVMLGFGRALGETMAVTMVIGNAPSISASLFAPSYTIASVIANEFTEATTKLYVSSLIELALILFAISMVFNAVARLLVSRERIVQ